MHFLAGVYMRMLFFSCMLTPSKSSETTKGLFKLLDFSKTGIRFANSFSGRSNFNTFNYRNKYYRSGVAIGEVNNDGIPGIKGAGLNPFGIVWLIV